MSYEMKGVGQRGKGKIESSFTLKNAAGLEAPAIELRGPFGPNLGKIEFNAGAVVREHGTVVEDVTPDIAAKPAHLSLAGGATREVKPLSGAANPEPSGAIF